MDMVSANTRGLKGQWGWEEVCEKRMKKHSTCATDLAA